MTSSAVHMLVTKIRLCVGLRKRPPALRGLFLRLYIARNAICIFDELAEGRVSYFFAYTMTNPSGSWYFCIPDPNNKYSFECNGTTFTVGDHLDEFGTKDFYIDMAIVIGLVLVAGLMSGLLMGLMSMDKMNLMIIKNSGDDESKKHAARILPLIEKHHLLLVTILLTNTAATEALPVFLDRLVHPAVAIVISVSLVVLFGEIIPQAVCTRFGLQVGSYLSWLVWGLIFILFIVAWPIAKLLDALLGADHGTFFRRAELKELVHLHASDVHTAGGEPLTDDEVRIIRGAIDLKEKTVDEIMTPMATVFAIDVDDVLDRKLLQKIADSGHDRIPVYHKSRDHFVGIISVKNLIMIDPNANTHVRSIQLYRVPNVPGNMPLYDLLHQLQNGRSHMAIVLNAENYIDPMGVITLEDLVEELLQAEIMDEDDVRRQQQPKYHQREVVFLDDVEKDTRLQGYLHRRPSVLPVGALGGSPKGGDRRPSAFAGPSPMGRRPSVYPGPVPRRHSVMPPSAMKKRPSVFYGQQQIVPPEDLVRPSVAPATLSINDPNEKTPMIPK